MTGKYKRSFVLRIYNDIPYWTEQRSAELFSSILDILRLEETIVDVLRCSHEKCCVSLKSFKAQKRRGERDLKLFCL